ncbi:MAG: hypothetical protein M1374_03050 [Firmicutes bacterium]|nr:hypothetical protein [Bacillota bacterium]
MRNIKIFTYLSQISLVFSMAICTITLPQVAETNGGVSNFGNNPSTVAIYSLGFSCCALFFWLSANSLISASHKLKRIAYVFSVIGELYLLVLLSTFPRRYSFAYSRAHDYLGIALFFIEFIFSLWILLRIQSYSSAINFAITASGMAIGLISILKVADLLFVGQSVASIGFALLVCLNFPQVISPYLNNAGSQ